MSKKIAMLLTVSVLSAAVPAGTVMAEENTPTTVGQMEPGAPQTQGEAPSMNGEQQTPPSVPQGEAPSANGSEQQTPPSIPQGEAPSANGSEQQTPPSVPQGEAPSMNGEQQTPPSVPQGEAPSMNGEQQTPPSIPQGGAPSMNGEQQIPQQNPQMGGKPGMNMNQRPGRMGKGHQGGQGSFENLLKDGTITQETYDAIRNYMQENKPEAKTPETQNNAAEQNNEAVQNGAEAQESDPAQDNTTNTADGGLRKEKPSGMLDERKDLLDDLLKNNVITQEEYDAITAAQKAVSEDLKADGADTSGQEEEASGTGNSSGTGTAQENAGL